MDPHHEHGLAINRRHFFGRSSASIGALALGSMLQEEGHASDAVAQAGAYLGLPDLPHFAPKAKRVIYMFQSGAPSQMETFDYKPELERLHGTELPSELYSDQRLTGMTADQESKPVTKSSWAFHQYGECGAWASDLMPYTAGIVDDICFIKSMHTEAINHDPAITFFQSGHQQPGRPSIGAWFSYGLGSMNNDMPTFIVLLSKNTYSQAQPTYSRLWGSGFLPSSHQGVRLRSSSDPVLYLNDPAETDAAGRRRVLDAVADLNRQHHEEVGDPEIITRISQYEMAYRMQTSMPDLTDFSDEPESTFRLYGADSRMPGTHAANCLLARRLAERDVRFIQMFHRGWDNHNGLATHHPRIARETDQGSAALILDLKQRGLLDDTLVIWGGEFGRSVYAQGSPDDYGRDHHPRCFTIWLAGGGIKSGITYGKTDDFCYNITENPVHVHDLHATIMHCMGIDHTKLTHRFQGRDYRLTDVHGKVVHDLLV